MMKSRLYVLAAIVLAAAASRLLPHPPNFTPIAAMALFGGAYFQHRAVAFGAPLAAMLLSDLLIGFHGGMPFVYAAILLISGMGLAIRSRLNPVWIGGAALSASLVFFVVTNFGVWLAGVVFPATGLYPFTGAGLVSAFVAAIPFFGNTLAGDVMYTVLLFGGFALAERWFPVLRKELTPAGLSTARPSIG